MKAAILRRNWVAGGAETYLLDFGRGLRTAGFAVDYLSTEEGPPTQALAVLGRESEGAAFCQIADDAVMIERKTSSYDLFINGAAMFPIVGRARRNWLVVFAPGSGRPTVWRKARRLATASARRAADHLPASPLLSPARQRLRAYPTSSERVAFRSYERIIGVSHFVSDIVAVRHQRNCDTVYPAIRPYPASAAKEPLVVSIGRFAPWGNVKRHDVLIEAARLMASSQPNMRLALIGSLSSDAASGRYMTDLRSLAEDLHQVEFYVDADRSVVGELLSRATVYWHAAGYGLDAASDPDSVEQFGISIVEAMSAGALPFVFPAGGPVEIVQDGADGFYWYTPGQLADLTCKVVDDPRRNTMVRAAIERSLDFSFEQMTKNIRDLL